MKCKLCGGLLILLGKLGLLLHYRCRDCGYAMAVSMQQYLSSIGDNRADTFALVEKATGFSEAGPFHTLVRTAYDAVDEFVKAWRLKEQAERTLECYKNNLRNRREREARKQEVAAIDKAEVEAAKVTA